MQETLERERELHAQLQAHDDDDHEQDKASTSGEAVLRDLQKQLYEKHNRIVELVGAIEKYKLDSANETADDLFMLAASRSGTWQSLLEEIHKHSRLEHAKVTQTELVCESFRRNKKTSKFLKFQEPVSEEQKAREHLDSELGRTEYIIGGEEEKALFEREFEEKGNLIDYLAEELLCVGRKLEELEEEKEQIEEERKLFSREIAIWKAEKLQAHQELLEETGRLAREKLEVQRQAEKVCGDLQKQVKALEIDVEEQVSRFKELEQEKTTEVMDLRQQNQFLEKQLEKMRKFLDEQAFDREHERDVFQQEIQKLEQKLKATPKFQPVSEDQTREGIPNGETLSKCASAIHLKLQHEELTA
ncbi:uncharacterized protein [Notamacropus eugenii]|uniref:uncharacterized protein n=1 Tax=Notamacropus eugenii TaxID=9315 RepID=UPI003B67FF45